ncbi:hypothetical protein A2Z00_03350 [Candidatus Gottesmanbacteria bacterium RBG_13_45_10]|uniref:DUF5678 domain-containing protein n=1 Tax=Candidatus Gottesmanbacteria bacterium RBG_13_45_10 TaxID=1798370 RepID=A0A1F5ZIV4_9BACT|nr:MAG: hypothetical protein A2Z00_03350 [Candidatus Gottesmanbacteria bacterium RBG_13_45_10]
MFVMEKKINFVKLLKNYRKGWVAISADFKRVVFSGKTLASTRKKAKDYKDKLYYFPSGEKYSDFFG